LMPALDAGVRASKQGTRLLRTIALKSVAKIRCEDRTPSL
jgi:hypothetical protein